MPLEEDRKLVPGDWGIKPGPVDPYLKLGLPKLKWLSFGFGGDRSLGRQLLFQCSEWVGDIFLIFQNCS